VLEELLDRIVAALSLALDLVKVNISKDAGRRRRTLPSEALVTWPVTPTRFAIFWVWSLKQTPWTLPSTLYEICYISPAISLVRNVTHSRVR
tara:strand:- start:2418 stop:2693 length:276 start_codon:yes stop_codon:yes gene_type:complete